VWRTRGNRYNAIVNNRIRIYEKPGKYKKYERGEIRSKVLLDIRERKICGAANASLDD